MAFVVDRGSGTWELRESHATPAGPRSRTLVSFRTLTPEMIERAQGRASQPLAPEQLRDVARRAGAPVAASASDEAAARLLAELSAGRGPRPALRRLLRDVLGPVEEATSDSARAAAGWVGATPQRRGETLRDLLLLADRLPPSRARTTTRFPRLQSRRT